MTTYVESQEFDEKLLCCRLWILKIVELSASLVLSASELRVLVGTLHFTRKKSAGAAGAWAVPLREENMALIYTYIYVYIYDPGPRFASPPQWYGLHR